MSLISSMWTGGPGRKREGVAAKWYSNDSQNFGRLIEQQLRRKSDRHAGEFAKLVDKVTKLESCSDFERRCIGAMSHALQAFNKTVMLQTDNSATTMQSGMLRRSADVVFVVFELRIKSNLIKCDVEIRGSKMSFKVFCQNKGLEDNAKVFLAAALANCGQDFIVV